MKIFSYATFSCLFAAVVLSSCGLFSSDDKTYSIITTASPEEGGIITPSDEEFKEGEQITLRAEANEGWRFMRWEGDWSGTMNPAELVMTKDYYITAVFDKGIYSVNITIQGEGAVQEEVIQQKVADYWHGTQVRLAAVPDEGWRFVRWEGDWSGTMNPAELAMTKDYYITAVFKERTYNLNITIQGEGAVQEEVIQQKVADYRHGTLVRLTAVPDEGWQFLEWRGDVESSDSSVELLMDKENSVTAIFEVPRDTDTEIVEVTNPTTGRVWMDRNLGADRAATSSTDSQAYGDLYQWGRQADGHQRRNSLTTGTLSSTDQPGHGEFILEPFFHNDWRNPQNDDLWQGVNGVNNPCPHGYRLPTEAEWDAERLSWSSNDAAGAFDSPLKLPMAGARRSSSGSLITVDSDGYYRSSSVSGTYERGLNFRSRSAGMINGSRALGASVRCIKD